MKIRAKREDKWYNSIVLYNYYKLHLLKGKERDNKSILISNTGEAIKRVEYNIRVSREDKLQSQGIKGNTNYLNNK